MATSSSGFSGSRITPSDDLNNETQPLNTDFVGKYPPAKRQVLRSRREYQDWLLEHFPVLSDKEEPWRRCTDVILLPLMGLFFCVLSTILLIGFVYGDPNWLRREWDYQGRLCGIHPLLDERPYLYWPKAGEIRSPVCLARCPTVEDVANSKSIKLPRADQLTLDSSDGGSRILVSQALWVAQVPAYSTLPYKGRFCLPGPATPLPVGPYDGQTGGVMGVGTASAVGPLAKDSLLVALRLTHGQVLSQVRRWIGGVGNAWLLLLCGIVIIAVLGFLSALSAHICTTATLCTALIGLALGAIGGGSYLLAAGVVQANQFATAALNSLQPSIAQGLGGILVAGGVVTLALALLLRATLVYASSTINIVTALLLSEPALSQIVWVPFIAALCQVVLCLVWLQILPWLASVAYIVWPSVPPPGSPWYNATNVDVTTLPTDWAPVFPGGPAVLTMGRQVYFSSLCPVLVLLSLFFLRLGFKLIEATGHFVIGYICALWYFTEPSPTTGRRPLPKCPLWDAYVVAWCRHPGSVCLAAVLHTVTPASACRVCMEIACALLVPWRPPRAVDRASDKKPPPEGCAVKLGRAAQRLQILFSPAVLTEVALRSETFCDSAARVWTTIPLALPAVQKIFGLPSLIGIIVSVFLGLAAGASVLAWLSYQQPQALSYSESPIGVAILLWALSYNVVQAWSLFYIAPADALLHCFASDDSENRLFQLDLSHGEQEVLPQTQKVDASFALWSSPLTPPGLRAWVFKVSSSLKGQDTRTKHLLKEGEEHLET